MSENKNLGELFMGVVDYLLKLLILLGSMLLMRSLRNLKVSHEDLRRVVTTSQLGNSSVNSGSVAMEQEALTIELDSLPNKNG